MVLYERRASMDARDFGGGSSQRRPPPFAPAPGPSFLRPAFPQDDVLRPAPRHQPPPPRANQDRAAAADNLLSLIQSARPRGSYEGGPRGRGESGSTSEDQTPPLGRGRKRQELQELNSSPIVKKKRPGRPAKPVREEDMQDGDQPKRKRRDKKPTYIVRKEKKAMLEAELVQLKQQVLQLRRASGIPDAFFMEKERLIAKAQDNDRLRAESRKQDMLLRNAHAILSAEYLMKRSESPIETFIHLTGDLKQRRAALVDIREMKLKQADDFITERSKFLPQISHWCQENKFESEEGHFYAEKMDNTPFHGARSVRQVFEALQFFFRNMEISISEMLGDITVREDDDSTASNSFSNHRLVSTMAHGVKVEKNIVKFFQLVEPDVDDDNEGSASYALVSTDSVDLDDMYPYVPDERIRMDINAAMKFTEHFCKKPPNRKRKTRTKHPLYGNGGFPYQQDPEEEEEAEDDEFERVVVLTRFFRVKLHHTEMDIPPHVLQEIRQGLACFSDTMVRSMHRVIFESRQKACFLPEHMKTIV